MPSPRRSLALPTLVLLAISLTLAGGAVAASQPARHPAKAAAAAAASPAAEPWEGEPFSATPAALAAAAAKVPGEEGDDAVVLLADASYRLDETGRETYTQRLVYRVLTTAAQESWSTFEESWEPWHQERPVVRARVITADGVEHPLDPVTLTESSQTPDDPDMFEDGKVLRAPLPAIRPGAVVEQLVTVRDTAPFFAAGVVRQHGFDLGVLVRHSRLVLDAPAATPLRWVSRGLPGMAPRDAVENGRRRLTFEVRDLEPAEDAEPGLPPEVPRTAYVAFSTGRSWEELARRYSEIVDQAIRGSDVAAFLRSAGGPAASQLETIDRLLARMSDEVRYTGIELGEGGLIPRKPAETLKRRFGDCKDKAVLLTALLRASDIPAYVALLNAGDDEADVEPSLPGLGLFDHAIVVVPGSPAIWIDPTDPYVRAGELPTADQGRLALIASATAAELVKTPESTSAENRQSESREFFLAGYGPSRVVSTSEYHGAVERDLRALYAGQDGPTLRQALREYAAAAYLSGDLMAVAHSQPANLAAPLVLRMEIKNVRRGFTDERNAAVGLNPAALLTHLPAEITGGAAAGAAGAAVPAGNGKEKEGEKPEPRHGDYVFSRPLTAEVRYRIVPPAGYVPQPLPAARSRRLGTASLAEEYAVDAAGVVTATLRLDTGKRRISPAEFDALRAGVRAALQEKGTRLIFDQVGELHLAAGRVREALAEFAREAAQEPRQALPHTRIARALLAGGMGEAAREEARQAVRLEPKSALAWRALGRVLEHDELGRPFAAGFDRAGALAALRKAKELDLQDAATRGDLAVLLEHDPRGRRYTAGADLAAAVDEYRALRKELGTAGGAAADESLLTDLVRSGRYAEARELAAGLPDSPAVGVLSLVAVAATDGVEAAIREADHRFDDNLPRAAALRSAAQLLVLARRYPEAAALIERAGRQSDDAAAQLALADLLRRMRRYEDAAPPPGSPPTPATPETLARQLVILTAAPLADSARLAALFSRESREATTGTSSPVGGDAWPQRLAAGSATARRQLRLGELPPDVGLDFTLAALRESVSGDDATGYRVVLSFPLERDARELAVYVVQEEGGYRIAALGDARARLGDQVLRRLRRNDLGGARRWLDWARADADADGRPRSPEEPADPFPALWPPPPGAPGATDAIAAADARCAALVLLAPDSRTLPQLEACRAAAPEPRRRQAFDTALCLAYGDLHRWSEMHAAAGRLLAAAPGSQAPERLAVRALEELGKWDEVRALGERRLERSADDPWARELLAEAALRRGDPAAAEAPLRQLVASGQATASDYNSLAWLRLQLGRVDAEALDYAQRAAALTDYAQPELLHTLAALYAELGRTPEAYRIVVQAVAARPDGSPAAGDWYVFGRLAESYGLPAAARRYYRLVAAPKLPGEEPMSTHALAARRLAVLGPAGDEKKPQARAGL
jgi:transglutaminase-like putative cysteine protease/tetratricopeptide (TPR) repeat protein